MSKSCKVLLDFIHKTLSWFTGLHPTIELTPELEANRQILCTIMRKCEIELRYFRKLASVVENNEVLLSTSEISKFPAMSRVAIRLPSGLKSKLGTTAIWVVRLRTFRINIYSCVLIAIWFYAIVELSHYLKRFLRDRFEKGDKVFHSSLIQGQQGFFLHCMPHYNKLLQRDSRNELSELISKRLPWINSREEYTNFPPFFETSLTSKTADCCCLWERTIRTRLVFGISFK